MRRLLGHKISQHDKLHKHCADTKLVCVKKTFGISKTSAVEVLIASLVNGLVKNRHKKTNEQALKQTQKSKVFFCPLIVDVFLCLLNEVEK